MADNTPSSFSSGTGNIARIGDLVVQGCETIPHPPEGLEPYGQQKWYEIANVLKGRGTWSTDWQTALYTLCTNLQMLEDIDIAIREAQKHGMFNLLVSAGKNTGLKTNPILEHRLKLTGMLQTQMAHFGLTPISAKACFMSDIDAPKKDDSQIESRPKVIGFENAA